ncbi:hypothetical protein EBR21_18160 [bacterium]|nr:hypothetical protein [bacterium]
MRFRCENAAPKADCSAHETCSLSSLCSAERRAALTAIGLSPHLPLIALLNVADEIPTDSGLIIVLKRKQSCLKRLRRLAELAKVAIAVVASLVLGLDPKLRK